MLRNIEPKDLTLLLADVLTVLPADDVKDASLAAVKARREVLAC